MSEENKEEIKKEGFFKKVLKSIKDFDKYEDFVLEKPGESFKYLIKIVAIFCAIVCIAYTYNILNNMNKLYTGIKDKVPEFSYENGELKTETDEPTIIEEYGEMIGTIIVDTQMEQEDIPDKYSDSINKYGSGIIFTKENLIIYNSGLTGQVSYKYADILSSYNIQNVNKQDLINNIDNINIVSISLSVYFMIFIYLFIIYFISIMIDVLILSLLAYIISRFSRIKLKFTPSFNIGVHAITLPVILNLIYIVVNLFTGFEVKYFQLMYNTISYIYVIVAILMIKTDFLNRQAELIKIAREQMKIKEELKKREEEEKKKKEEDKDKPVEKDNKEKGENDNPDIGVAPQGDPQGNNGTKQKKQTKKKREKSEQPSGDEPVGDASFNSNE